MTLDAQLVRRESGRLTAALIRIFGVHNLALVEDVVQDAFCRALAHWHTDGVPDAPGAWLMTAAKRRALDIVRRDRTARRFAPEMGRLLDTEWTIAPVIEEAFAAPVIRDEQLRMMFSCCHPRLAADAQLALVLHVLCGFRAADIAAALLTGRAAIEKRIARGKHALAGAQRLFELGDAALPARLATVQRALYLLFNEGYHGARGVEQPALCDEAIRLVELLLAHPATATPATHALAAAMHLHAARAPARLAGGGLVAFGEQDRTRWDHAQIARGLAHLEASAAGGALSPYHLEAAIAAAHASAPSAAATDWSLIAGLYDRLLALQPSPVIALNRAIAVAGRDGPAAGLAALAAIAERDRLAGYPFYPAAIAELELRRDNRAAARAGYREALAQARNAAERRFLMQRLAACE